MRIPVPSAKIAQPAKAAPPPSLASRPAWKPRSERGTVVLVALCFVAVLGLMLASYLAVTSRAMQLSNRSFQSDLSRQLAEAGLEEALRAFNKNDWSDWTGSGMSVDWTLDAAARRATATISYPSNKFSQGLTAQVKIRVDNYDALNRSSSWTSGTSYDIDDLVGHNGVWYRCLFGHTASGSNQPPNLNFWAPEGLPWKWVPNTRYATEDLVNVGGKWYRCTEDHLSGSTFPTSQWEAIHGIYLTAPPSPYVPASPAGQKAYVRNSTGWSQLTHESWDGDAPISWRWREGQLYELNDVICWNGTWYRCASAHTSAWWPDTVANPSNPGQTVWKSIGTFWPWNASTTYNRGDVVVRNDRWYRCLRPHTNQQPPNSAYWADAPLATDDWTSGKSYPINSVVKYNGVWYRNTSDTSTQPPNSPWVSAADTSWNATSLYSGNDYVSYGGVWYRCLVAHSNQSPNNSTYWTAVNAPVIYSESQVALPSETPIRTQLRASVDLAPLLPNAIAARQTARFATSGTVDSYDASISGRSYSDQINDDTNFSAVITGGNTTDNAVIMSGSLTTSGYVAAPPLTTSPYAPRFSYSSSAVVKRRFSAPSPKVDPSRLHRSPHIPNFAILTQPNGQSLTLSSGSGSVTNIGTPGATTPSYYYYSGTLTIDNHTLNILGPVVIQITGGLQTQSKGRIVIHPSGSAVIKFDGRLYIGDNGSGAPHAGIENLTLDPSKCVLLGTSTYNNSAYHYFWQRRNFYGIVYMPDAYLHLWNSGYSPNIYGAISARNVYFNHTTNFHYDTSLRYKTFPGVEQPYTVSELRELPADEWATLP